MTYFKCGTRFDYYLMKKNKIENDYLTTVIAEDNIKTNIILKNKPFIPNKNIEEVYKIISLNSNENINVLRPGSDPRREHIKDVKDDTYKFTLIHSTPEKEIRYKYSNENKNTDHFGIKKIVFGETGINKNMVIDLQGDYGVTCCAFGFEIENNNDAEKIKNALLSKNFQKIIESCSWGNFRIDWRLFTYFKKDFWKEFI
jgi:hypothetical protein